MPDFPSQSLESLHAQWSGGDQRSLPALVPLLDHQLTHANLPGERPVHTLQTTESFNETYLRPVEQGSPTKDRRRFVAVADALNRQILVDCGRPHRATVMRDWSMAQTWLSRRRKRGDGGRKGMGKN